MRGLYVPTETMLLLQATGIKSTNTIVPCSMTPQPAPLPTRLALRRLVEEDPDLPHAREPAAQGAANAVQERAHQGGPLEQQALEQAPRTAFRPITRTKNRDPIQSILNGSRRVQIGTGVAWRRRRNCGKS
jgi:hypothetical protein